METPKRITPEQANALMGRKVKEARAALNLSQSELAERLTEKLQKTTTTSTVSRLESGDRPTTIADLYALAEALSADVRDLLPQNEPLEDAVMPIFIALDAIKDRIRHLKKDLRAAESRKKELDTGLESYYIVHDGVLASSYSHETTAVALENLYDLLEREGIERPAMRILGGLNAPIEARQDLLAAFHELTNYGRDDVDHEAIKQKLVSLVFEYFPREV